MTLVTCAVLAMTTATTATAADDAPITGTGTAAAGPVGAGPALTTTTLVSRGATQDDRGESFFPRISGDGGTVAYVTTDRDQTGGLRGFATVVWDRSSRTSTLINTDADGELVRQQTPLGSVDVSGNGRFVVFTTDASLSPRDRDANPFEASDAYIWDRRTGKNRLITAASKAIDAEISDDGRYLAFERRTNDRPVTVLRDLETGVNTRVAMTVSGGPAKGGAYLDGLSANGRYVLFSSTSGELAPNDANTSADAFVWDRLTKTTTLISTNPSGASANDDTLPNKISADGRYVVMDSYATDLDPDVEVTGPRTLEVYRWDRETGSSTLVSTALDGRATTYASHGSMSDDGRFVTFGTADQVVAGDTNGVTDLFVWDATTGAKRLVSAAVDAPSSSANGSSILSSSLSADGSAIAFDSAATNLTTDSDQGDDFNVFLRSGR